MGGIFLKTVNLRRARCRAGGIYFRARKVGIDGNNISVQVVPNGRPDGAMLVVTNYTIKPDEMIIGPATAEIFDSHLKWDERIAIKDLTTNPSARSYSISSKIGAAIGPVTQLGPVRLTRLFGVPGKIAAKLTPDYTKITPESEIIITPRQRVYDLERFSAAGGGPWDFDLLSSEINSHDPWIEIPMPGFDVQEIPHAPLHSALTVFGETWLSGGDGPPLIQDGEMIHVNYQERIDGTMCAYNKVYSWKRSTSEWSA